jgi:hypothetical protein
MATTTTSTPAGARARAAAGTGGGSRLSTRRGLLISLLLCGAQFLVVLDATIVNVALPSIQRALDFTEQNLQWVASGYALTFAGFLLLGGRAADLLGRRHIFMAVVLAAPRLISGGRQASRLRDLDLPGAFLVTGALPRRTPTPPDPSIRATGSIKKGNCHEQPHRPGDRSYRQRRPAPGPVKPPEHIGAPLSGGAAHTRRGTGVRGWR